MPSNTATDRLQAPTVISKTTPVVIGPAGNQEIRCAGYSFLTLLLDYIKGDETGVDIYPYFMRESGGDEHPVTEWTGSAGIYTSTVQKIRLTATVKRAITFDVRGIEIMKFYQGGSNNDGTPTGTLEVSYILDEA